MSETPEWTQEQIDRCNADMAAGIIAEIREVLDAYGCIHGKDHEGTPPMFYPEMVRCAIVSARHAMAKEAAAIVRKYLAFDSQRAVSWHEVQDCAEAISAAATAQPQVAVTSGEQEEAPVTPKRIQRKRAKGWRMPEGVVYVGRPGRWGNPFTLDGWRGAFLAVMALGERGDARGCRTAAVKLYRLWLTGRWRTVREDTRTAFERELTPKIEAQRPTRREIRAALRGKDLACWCPPGQPCHADVLLEIANA